jgi:V/A-type H+-transporting ATPase subunit D
MAELRGVPPGRAGRLWLQARLQAGHRADVTVSWDTLMGLRYPAEATCHVPAPSTSERGPGSAALVEAAAAARDALSAAAEHAAAVTARRIIDAEVAATRRRLRAITHRWLPQLEDALRRLTHDLDETEQAETFRLRWAAAHVGRDGC